MSILNYYDIILNKKAKKNLIIISFKDKFEKRALILKIKLCETILKLL